MTGQEPIKRILLYVDGSEACITAAQYGIALSKSMNAELIALYVVNISLLQELTKARIFVKIEEMDYEQDLEQDGKRYLRYISEMAKSKGLEITTELAKGVVNKVVSEKADNYKADLLVMGELDPVLSRSDSYHDEGELIFRKVKCSVLVVKNPDLVEQVFSNLDS
ncbi:universal stress protein [bacterium]|nr:universal stress protein [bacterium]